MIPLPPPAQPSGQLEGGLAIVECAKILGILLILYFLMQDASISRASWSPWLIVLNLALAAVSYWAATHMPRPYKSAWRNYLVVFYFASALCVVAWANLGTPADFFPAGNELVELNVRRSNRAIEVFCFIFVPGLLGIRIRRARRSSDD